MLQTVKGAEKSPQLEISGRHTFVILEPQVFHVLIGRALGVIGSRELASVLVSLHASDGLRQCLEMQNIRHDRGTARRPEPARPRRDCSLAGWRAACHWPVSSRASRPLKVSFSRALKAGPDS